MSVLPQLFAVRQKFASHALDDLTSAVHSALDGQSSELPIQPGQSVAVAVGSRGIANLPTLVRGVVDWIKAKSGVPIIVPAMGSHGGATGEGQAKVLRGLGVEPTTMGCPIRSSMETVEIGKVDGGLPVFCDANAQVCDHIIVVNRIKPHTRLTGALQSGLAKMLLIGLGKHCGAVAYHEMFAESNYCLDSVAPRALPVLLAGAPVRLGLAVIEDAFEQTSHVEAVPARQILTREIELQRMAASWMPSLPFDEVDLLIIDQIGKEISGTGMDTNVVGRKWHDKVPGPDETPRVEQIYVRGLTRQTSGNACGIGIAEYCRTQVVRDMDQQATWVNCLTGRHVTAAAVPMHFETDREVLQTALSQVRDGNPDQARWMWIGDTLRLGELRCSEAYLSEAEQRSDLDVIAAPQPIVFDREGQLSSW
ncbi:MAG: lactate racemase domain-containing protein [Planctomycetota bacterium]